jgi:indole-3-acetate monooxygenase
MAPEEERAALFARIDGIAPTLDADIAAGDELRRLPDTTVDALRRSGLLRLKVPAALGGHEAEPGLQFEVFERVAMINVAAAWCFFIWADSVGDACARIADDGLARLLADGDVPIVCGGGGLRPGALRSVPGGYRMDGTFRYGSGIHAASWVLLFGRAVGDGGRPELRACLVAKDDLALADDWHVLGMRGTGSVGFAADDVFVPAEMTYSASGRPRRGGRVYRTGIIGYLGFPLPAVTLAIARRALDELTATAANVTRGYARPRPLAERATFQRFLGEADVRLAAARALMLACGSELMDAVERGRDELRAVEAGVRAAGANAARVASDVLADTVRFAGGAATREGSVYERAVRDLTVAASHLIVDESAYENHAQFMLGLPGADPLA